MSRRAARILLALLATSAALPAQPPEPRLGPGDAVSLFDGQSLAGWVTRGGRYDGAAAWSVEEGAIVGRQGADGAGGLLYTARSYRNFVLSLETRIDHPFDSGIFVRMTPREKGAQVTLDYRPGGEVGAIYSDGFLHHETAAKEAWIADGWNRFTVLCTGSDLHLVVWMNGRLVTDYRLPEGSSGYAARGLVGLQVHGGEGVPPQQAARFRNVALRELPDDDQGRFDVDARGCLHLLEKGRKDGWRALFDGHGFGGFEDPGKDAGWRVVDGLLVQPREGAPGTLRSREDFRDFELRLDFRTSRMANSGVFLRAARDGTNPAYSGCEVQILDDFDWERLTGTKLQPSQFTGSLYGSVAPRVKDALKPHGQWNTFEIRFEGSRLACSLNGKLLYDVDTLAVPGKPFARRAARGFIGLQRYAAHDETGELIVSFRNLFVRPL